MKLKELLSVINSEKVFEIAYKNLQKDTLFQHKNIDEEKARKSYFAVIDEINAMRNRKTAEGSIVVAKVKEFGGNERFDVFLIKPNDNEHYSLSLSSWSEYLSHEIHEGSIKRYGAETVAEAIIYDMTFFGASQKQHSVRSQSVRRSLIVAEREDASKAVPAEQVFAELREEFGLPQKEEKTEGQKLAEHKVMEYITRENCNELDLLNVPYRKND